MVYYSLLKSESEDMKYIILGEDNKEYGPIDGETLKKWVESGRVLSQTPVRNSMIKKWNKAEDFDFLIPSLAVQYEKIEDEKGFKVKSLEILGSIFKKKTSKKSFDEGSTYRNRYLPNPPGIPLRLLAVFFDGVIVSALFILLFMMSAAMVQGGMNPNEAFLNTFPLFICGIFLYYGLTLGLYAQTFGMWFWGMILVKPDLGEVYLGRAYLYSVLMVIFSISTPFIVFLNPAKRSLPEIFSGTMIIRTAARAKT